MDEEISRRNIYIALEDVDFVWDERQIHEVESMFHAGATTKDIARMVKRPLKDVIVALLDRNLIYGVEKTQEVRSKRLYRSPSTMTREQYLSMKRDGMTDGQIAEAEQMSPSTLVERKRAWGLLQGRGGDTRKKRQQLIALGDR